jgi:hypothetical protein
MDRILAGETDYVKLKLDVWKQEHSDAIRVFREDESCYKAERKKETRATRIAAAKLNAAATKWPEQIGPGTSLWCSLVAYDINCFRGESRLCCLQCCNLLKYWTERVAIFIDT